MKKHTLSLFALIISIQPLFSQDCPRCPSQSVMDNTDLIFEGRILTDSAYMQNPPGDVRTFHKVLVLKQFKGTFKSDTIRVVSWGGRMIYNGQSEGTPGAFAFRGDEAIFFVSVMKLGNTDPDLYYILYGAKGGFAKLSDEKDVVKDLYEPIEKVTGHPYIDVHPNTYKGQQKKPAAPIPMKPDGTPVESSPSPND